MMGMFGMLAVALMVLRSSRFDRFAMGAAAEVLRRLVLGIERRTVDDGRAQPVAGRHTPVHGCHGERLLARPKSRIRGQETSLLIEWLRTPGDVVFIVVPWYRR